MKVLPQQLQAARFSLTRSHPYINSVLLNLNFIEKPGLGTFGVDKHWRCYYDPATLTEWDQKTIQGVLFHEINHILRDHHGRGELFDSQEKYNIAGDMEINPDVIEAGFTLPQGVVFPKMIKMPDGELAETYYHKIPEKKIQVSGVGAGQCGSCAQHGSVDGEEEAPAQGESMSNAERDLIKRQCAKEIENASKSQGNVPAGLRRWADQVLHPQVKWTKELASVIRRAMIEVAGKQDRTFKRPSRVSGALGGKIVLPGWKAYFPNVAMVQDTSGSMSGDDLAKSMAEAKGVLQALGGNGFGVTFIDVDCAVGSKKRISSIKQVNLSGGGGTDMGIGIQAAIDTKPRVDVCIVLTDGDTPWPSVPPPFKTIVVLTSGQRDVPEWAKAIVVN